MDAPQNSTLSWPGARPGHRARAVPTWTGLLLLFLLAAGRGLAQEARDVSLAWDPSSSTNATGYMLYYGFNSGSRAFAMDVGPHTTATVTNLETWVTYFFSVVAYTATSVESDAVEISYIPVGSTPPNLAPTLDAIADLSLPLNAGASLVRLTGISSGGPWEDQWLTITARSSNPDVLPNPIVIFDLLFDSGSLILTPVLNANGRANITVTINDGATRSNQVSRSFRVAVGTPPVTNILVEAEAGQITSPMRLATGSGETYVSSPTANAGSGVYQLAIPQADDYLVWCRVVAPNSGSDSFFVSVDGGAEDVYDVAQNSWSSSWQWNLLNGRNAGNPWRLALTRGQHTLKFRAREANTLLDAIFVSNDPAAVPVNALLRRVTSPRAGMEVSFTSPAGYRYDVQASEDLRSWTTLWRSPVANSNQRFAYVDSANPGSGRRFYRLLVQ